MIISFLNLPRELQQHIALIYLTTARDYATLCAVCRSLRNMLWIPRAGSFALQPTSGQLGAYQRAVNSVLVARAIEQGRIPATSDSRPLVAALESNGISTSVCGTQITYSTAFLAKVHGWTHSDIVTPLWDREFDWHVPTVRIPQWAKHDEYESVLRPTQGDSDQQITVFEALQTLDPVVLQTQFGDSIRRGYRVGLRHKTTRTVHSRLPLNISSPIKYFECKLHGPDVQAIETCVGLLSPNGLYKPTHALANDMDSVSYECGYGMINVGARFGEGFQFAQEFTNHDTIGVGILSYEPVNASKEEADYHAALSSGILFPTRRPTTTIYFTKNGCWVGDAPARISSDLISYDKTLFPAIGFTTYDPKLSITACISLGQNPTAHQFSMQNFINVLCESDTYMQARVMESTTSVTCHMDLRYLPPSTLDVETTHAVPSPHTLIHTRLVSCQGKMDQKSGLSGTGPVISGHASHTHIVFQGNRYTDVANVQSPIPLQTPNTCRSQTYRGYFEVTVIRNSEAALRAAAVAAAGDDGEEAEFMELSDEQRREVGFLAVGVAMRPCSPFYHVGWDFGSFAYHSDDGKLFDGAGQGGFEWGPPFSVNDTIGCGLTNAGDLYFTKNGSRIGPRQKRKGSGWVAIGNTEEKEDAVGIVPSSHFGWRLHPTISACMDWEISVNFGDDDFVYKN